MAAATETGAKRWARDYIFDILRILGVEYMFGVPGTIAASPLKTGWEVW